MFCFFFKPTIHWLIRMPTGNSPVNSYQRIVPIRCLRPCFLQCTVKTLLCLGCVCVCVCVCASQEWDRNAVLGYFKFLKEQQGFVRSDPESFWRQTWSIFAGPLFLCQWPFRTAWIPITHINTLHAQVESTRHAHFMGLWVSECLCLLI